MDKKISSNSNNNVDNKKVKTNMFNQKIFIILLLVMCITIYMAKAMLNQNEKNNLKTYQAVIQETQKSVMQYEEEYEAQKQIRIEAELREKIANRNKIDFTPEQVNIINNIYNSSNTKIAYLTFDDGPSGNVTPLILDVLKEQNIKATFFVLGINVKWHPNTLNRIRNESHYIANHGYTHIYDDIYESYENLINEYNMCEQAIRDALGEPEYKTRIFRFPGGSTGGQYARFKNEAKLLLQQQNIAFLDWNCLTCDAEGVPTKESIIENLKSTSQGKNNLVILMHDSSSKILTYETLTEVINYLREQGYEFGDMYELIGE